MRKLIDSFFLITVATVLILSSLAFSAPNSQLHEQMVGQTVRDLCAQDDQILFVGHFYLQARDAISREIAKTMHDKNFDMHTVWKASGGLTPELDYMLNSFTFMREMAVCFPDESTRNSLVLKVILADLAGQLTATTQMIAFVVGPGKVAGFAVKKLYPVYLKIMGRFPKLAPLSEKALSWSIEAITTFSTLGYFISDKFSFFKEKPEEVIRVQSRIVLLEKRMAQIETVMTQHDPKSNRHCVYQDVLYQFAQEFLQLSRKIKSDSNDTQWQNRINHAKKIESCHPVEDTGFVVPII